MTDKYRQPDGSWKFVCPKPEDCDGGFTIFTALEVKNGELVIDVGGANLRCEAFANLKEGEKAMLRISLNAKGDVGIVEVRRVVSQRQAEQENKCE